VGGTEVQVEWRGRPVRAWRPDLLADLAWDPTLPTVRHTERAAAALIRVADRLPPNWEPSARLLLRAEGVASSYVEGVRAPLVDVAVAELDDEATSAPAAWVADNLEVVTGSLADARRGALTVDDLHRWHARLMAHSPLPADMRGGFRTAQGWVGGSTPLDAAFVPPPPELLRPLMDDLVGFANRFDLDPVTQAAVLHGQFETIHPYADGNGRIGRVLIGWLLVRRTDAAVPPPVSVVIARDPGGYLSGLHRFRTGAVDAWVAWFAAVVERAASATLTLIEDIAALLGEWTDQLDGLRADATARRLVPVLPEMPVLSAPLAATRLGVSAPAARAGLGELHERRILRPIDLHPPRTGRPATWFVADGLLELIRRWSA
jgi:Fic family protein